MKARIYHNPRCSQSRAALALLQAQGIEVEIIEYLNHPPSKTTLKSLLTKLGVPAKELVRSNEPEFKLLLGERPPSDEWLLDILVKHPRLLQRPIVEVGDRARIGRPPETVLELTQ